MSYVFSFFLVMGTICYLLTGRISELMKVVTQTTSNCGTFVLQLMFLTAFFSGIIKIGEDIGLTRVLSKFLRPVLNRLFHTKSDSALQKIATNISANLLGIGNAATPSGLCAMKELDKENQESQLPSDDMCRFLLFNTCSVQLIPTTILGLRAMAGSNNSSVILLPVICVSITSLLVGLLLCNQLLRLRK